MTTPCRVFCQGAKYRRHMIELGLNPDAKAFNMFFVKSDASISAPIGTVRPPGHVKLLDYEIELALGVSGARSGRRSRSRRRR